MAAPDLDVRARTDWVIVDRRTGMILRGLPRWEVAYLARASVAAIEAELEWENAYMTPEWIVVGEWRPK